MLTLKKWAPEYAEQDANDLHAWSTRFVGYMWASADHIGRPKRPLARSGRRGEIRFKAKKPIPHRFAGNKQNRESFAGRVVPGTGLEPASRKAADFKSAMFTNFITPAGVRPHVDANSTIAGRAHQTATIPPRSTLTFARQGQKLESSSSHKRSR